jgi:hypothetical protein
VFFVNFFLPIEDTVRRRKMLSRQLLQFFIPRGDTFIYSFHERKTFGQDKASIHTRTDRHLWVVKIISPKQSSALDATKEAFFSGGK